MQSRPITNDDGTMDTCYCIEAVRDYYNARFNGEWIGQSKDYSGAVMVCINHKNPNPVIKGA